MSERVHEDGRLLSFFSFLGVDPHSSACSFFLATCHASQHHACDGSGSVSAHHAVGVRRGDFLGLGFGGLCVAAPVSVLGPLEMKWSPHAMISFFFPTSLMSIHRAGHSARGSRFDSVSLVELQEERA